MAAAARALDAVAGERGCTAEVALRELNLEPVDRAAVRALHSGTLRWYLRLAPMVDALLEPGQQMAPLVRAVLTVALHQIDYSRARPESVVNIAVDAVRALGEARASGFTNALLRRFLRERDQLAARFDRSEPARLAHPRWLLKALRSAWPDEFDRIVAASNEQPPMTLRVNLARSTREAMLAELLAAGIGAAPGPAPASLVIDQPLDVRELPGFMEGRVSVQDAGAQWAAELLDAQPGEHVLDACAAPGGKTGHILERTRGELDLTALDADSVRLARVSDNIARLGYGARLVAAELEADGWWDGRPFDRILLDAPCSGTGVVRRHPDIKLLRRADDIAGFAAAQLRLLERCAALLASGGRLVYATCSILPRENQEVVDRFLRGHHEFRRGAADTQLLPQPLANGAAAVTDGFYYACLIKEVAAR
jgi:16S rRNA (cytosine967-C5)-methyltransferase